MTEHTPTPWKVEENCLGVYPISAKQGPIVVQPAKAFGEEDAAFIVKSVNSHDALVKALTDALCELSHCADQLGAREYASVRLAMAEARRILDLVGDGKVRDEKTPRGPGA